MQGRPALALLLQRRSQKSHHNGAASDECWVGPASEWGWHGGGSGQPAPACDEGMGGGGESDSTADSMADSAATSRRRRRKRAMLTQLSDSLDRAVDLGAESGGIEVSKELRRVLTSSMQQSRTITDGPRLRKVLTRALSLACPPETVHLPLRLKVAAACAILRMEWALGENCILDGHASTALAITRSSLRDCAASAGALPPPPQQKPTAEEEKDASLAMAEAASLLRDMSSQVQRGRQPGLSSTILDVLTHMTVCMRVMGGTKLAGHLGVCEALCLLLGAVWRTSPTWKFGGDNSCGALIASLVSCLRAVLRGKSACSRAEGTGAVVAMCGILADGEPCRKLGSAQVLRVIQLDAVRVLARLSLLEGLRREIDADPHHLRDIFGCVERGCLDLESDARAHRLPLLTASSAALCLGNLTATNDANRGLLGVRFGAALALPSLLRIVCDAYAAFCGEEGVEAGGEEKDASLDSEGEGDLGSVALSVCTAASNAMVVREDLEDLAAKMVRLTANVATRAEAGMQMAAQEEAPTAIGLLGTALQYSAPTSPLLLGAVSLVTNLTFYGGGTQEESDDDSPENALLTTATQSDALCSFLVSALLCSSDEVVSEAARAVGNVSRLASIRAGLSRCRASEVLIALLAHPAADVVYGALGGLMNMAADPAIRSDLRSQGAGSALTQLLRRVGLAKLDMSIYACRVLHNLLMEPLPGRGGGVMEALGGGHATRRLVLSLSELLSAAEDACSLGHVEDEKKDQAGGEDVYYGPFISAAGGLLARIEAQNVYEIL